MLDVKWSTLLSCDISIISDCIGLGHYGLAFPTCDGSVDLEVRFLIP